MASPPAHVSRILKDLQWTPQKPIDRARQRNDTLIEPWRTEVWPELKKRRAWSGGPRYYIDEAGFYLWPALVRTYAPSGQTPVLKVPLTYEHLSVMSGLTLTGQLSTLVRTEALTGTARVCFLKHMQRYLGPRLLAIGDGSPIHRGDEVKPFLAEGGAPAILVEQLPPYAPDLNPDDGVWKLLKTDVLRNLCCLDLNHLDHELYLAVRRLRRQPSVLQSCFVEAGLALE